MLGDVEKVRWYEFKNKSIQDVFKEFTDVEIYDQDDLNALEEAYELRILTLIAPIVTVI
jgi:hypothetical protein